MPRELIIEPLREYTPEEIDKVAHASQLDLLLVMLKRLKEIESRVSEIINVINMKGA